MSDNSSLCDGGKLLFCSFCGKNQNEVRRLIAGPSVYICDECVDLCNDIISEEVQSTESESEAKPESSFSPSILEYCILEYSSAGSPTPRSETVTEFEFAPPLCLWL